MTVPHHQQTHIRANFKDASSLAKTANPFTVVSTGIIRLTLQNKTARNILLVNTYVKYQ